MPVYNVKKKKSFFAKLKEIDVSIGGVGITQIAFFAKTMAVMLGSGITITESLIIASESASGRLKKILKKVSGSVMKGRTLSESLGEYPGVFSRLFVNTIRVGESSGTLVENLENMSEQLEKQRMLVSKIKGAMLYPMVILAAAGVMGFFSAFFVLPKITPLLESLRVELPLTTKILIWVSHFVQDYGLYLAPAIIGGVVFFLWLLKQKFTWPVTHWLVIKLPVVKGISRDANISSICRTLGMLIRSGVTIDEALTITANSTGNIYYKKALFHSRERVRKGARFSEGLEMYPGLFPTIVVRMIRAGEESGSVDETLFHLADFYDSNLDASTKALSTAIEPILLLSLGLVVAFLALSIITPIFKTTGGIQK